MATPTRTPRQRETCARCQKPLRACYCFALPHEPLRTRHTRVVVLQHAKEQRQRQAISSVPVLAHVLQTPECCAVLPVTVGAGKGDHVTDALCKVLHQHLDPQIDRDDPDAVLVLFPHQEAKSLDGKLMTHWRPERSHIPIGDSYGSRKSVVLVVVDGTWTEAKKVMHQSQPYWDDLAQTRRSRGQTFEFVCIDSSPSTADDVERTVVKSIYGELRKEPQAGCVSTLEAVAMALRVLEEPEDPPHRLHDALCGAFQAMVEIQTQFQQQGRAQQQAKHGGTPKPSGNNGSQVYQQQPHSDDKPTSSSQGVRKPYVFYTTQTDFRQRQRLVQEGDVCVCTRDDAILKCSEMNRDRKRGSRVSTLPLHAFERHQQHEQQQQKEAASAQTKE